ncbi:MAG: menaquinone biosynthesis protein [Aquificae bacterium]|nr:menaquinone biosynthesis protein [Aquificota bacterium]
MRVGRVSFSNTIPLFYSLKGFEVVEGLPSELVLKLRKGEIDAGIVSSVEYFFNPDLYYILPGVSISSRGRVCSVKLFSPKPIEEISGVRITRASLTSRYLLHYIFEKKYGLSIPPEREDGEALLLIGDEAMEVKDFPFVYDLGKEWYELHRLPFVFALFLVRRDADPEEAKRLHREIIGSLRDFYSVGIKEGEKAYYFKECIDYSLGEEHLKALELFFGYLEEREGRKRPEPEFLKL